MRPKRAVSSQFSFLYHKSAGKPNWQLELGTQNLTRFHLYLLLIESCIVRDATIGSTIIPLRSTLSHLWHGL